MFKKKAPKLPTLGDISNRLRGYVMDSQVQNGHELSVILGCSVISEELQIHEEQESDKRVDKISHLIPLIYAFSHALAEGAIEYQRANLSADLKNIPEETWWESRKMMEQVSMSAILGTISQMVDMGMLEVTKKKKGLWKRK